MSFQGGGPGCLFSLGLFSLCIERVLGKSCGFECCAVRNTHYPLQPLLSPLSQNVRCKNIQVSSEWLSDCTCWVPLDGSRQVKAEGQQNLIKIYGKMESWKHKKVMNAEVQGELKLFQSDSVFFLEEEHKRLNVDVVLLYCPESRLAGHLCSWNLEMWCSEHCTPTLETGDAFLPHPMVSSSFYATVLST